MNQSELIDSGIELKMKKIRFINRRGQPMYVGVSLVLDQSGGKLEAIVIISDLVSNQKVKDAITGSITEICSWIYCRGMGNFTAEEILWMQHFPSSKKFSSMVEILIMEWIKDIESYKFVERQHLEGKALDRLIELIHKPQ